MLPKKNLRDRLAGQSGSLNTGSASAGGSELSRLIEAERAKIRDSGPDAAAKAAAGRKPPTASQAPRLGPTKSSASPAKGGKSTTNKGLRGS